MSKKPRKNKSKTIADDRKKTRPQSLAEQLSKPWSLTDCIPSPSPLTQESIVMSKKPRKNKSKTIADDRKKTRPQSLAEQLSKPWSLTDCKRITALVEMEAELQLKRARERDSLKHLKTKLEETENHRERERYALRIVDTQNEIKALADSIKASQSDLMRVVLESADGGTIWQQVQNASAQASPGDADGGPDDDSQLAFGYEGQP
jgi:hypothetical protein